MGPHISIMNDEGVHCTGYKATLIYLVSPLDQFTTMSLPSALNYISDL
jgi:hypothetical protein